MNDVRGFSLAVVGFFIGIALFIKGFRTFRRKRLMENIPTSKVESLAMGLVEVYGAALKWKERVFISPFTRSECFYCRYSIEECRRSGKSSRWVTIKEEIFGTIFYLKDDTGKVLVDPLEAEIDIPIDYQFESGIGNPPPPKVAAFLNENGIAYEGFLGFNKRMRYTEYFIAPDDCLYILGTAGDNPYVGEGTVQKGSDDVMIYKGGEKSTFYISDKSEKECLKSYSLKMILQIYGGAALNVGCLIYILFVLKIF